MGTTKDVVQLNAGTAAPELRKAARNPSCRRAKGVALSWLGIKELLAAIAAIHLTHSRHTAARAASRTVLVALRMYLKPACSAALAAHQHGR